MMCLQGEDECVSEDGLCITDVRLCGGLKTGGVQKNRIRMVDSSKGTYGAHTVCTVQGIKESQVGVPGWHSH